MYATESRSLITQDEAIALLRENASTNRCRVGSPIQRTHRCLQSNGPGRLSTWVGLWFENRVEPELALLQIDSTLPDPAMNAFWRWGTHHLGGHSHVTQFGNPEGTGGHAKDMSKAPIKYRRTLEDPRGY